MDSDFEDIKDVVTERMDELSTAIDSLDIDDEAKQYMYTDIKDIQIGMYSKLDSLSKCIKRMDGLIRTSELLAEMYNHE